MRSVLAFCPVPCIITSGFLSGEMAERLKAVDSKSTREKLTLQTVANTEFSLFKVQNTPVDCIKINSI